MKAQKTVLFRRFLGVAAVFAVCLSLLWSVFYLFTMRIVRKNLEDQAEYVSEAVISRAEALLLSLGEETKALSQTESMARALMPDTVHAFFERSLIVRQENAELLNRTEAGFAALIRKDGLFFRLKGTISNTALNRVYYLAKGNAGKNISFSCHGTSFLGCAERIPDPQGETAGYSVMLIDSASIDRLLSTGAAVDYLGVALMDQDRVISSNRGIRMEDIPAIKEAAVFYREREIGITGLRLFVFCESGLFSTLSGYFRIALPVTFLLFFLIMEFFFHYLNRHMIRPISGVIAESAGEITKPLSHTGDDYFDSLVDHVNAMLNRIESREKALYEAKQRENAAELEKERIQTGLLKKQISAHFTVNTLNSIRALIRRGDREDASRISDDLAALLRYANAGEENISLLEEFHILRQYMEIMEMRFPDRISLQIEEEDTDAELFIPRMLLQPIVENSIFHGLEGGSGIIRIFTELREGKLFILITDNGKGMGEKELESLRLSLEEPFSEEKEGTRHIALLNIQKRIQLAYGGEYGIAIRAREGEGTTVRLSFPDSANYL